MGIILEQTYNERRKNNMAKKSGMKKGGKKGGKKGC